MSNGTLNRALYAGLDFDTHNDDLRAQLQVRYAADFNDFAISSLGIMLLDLTAFGLDTLSFYLDRRATDTYLSTARTRKSVARASRQLGYKMGGAVASGVDVNFTVEEVFAFNVPIPTGFQLDGPDGLVYEVAEETIFTPADQGIGKYKPVPCYEGETIQESFTSDGTSAQVFELRRVPSDKYVVDGSVVGAVDGANWPVVDLIEHGATDQLEVGFNDEPPTIRFGDGISGNIPVSGASIEVTYVASRGGSGKVGAETITTESTKLVVAFTEIPLSLINPEGSSGGDDRETLSSAKTFAPKVWKSREVSVTGEDYESLSGRYADPLFGRVAVAKAISSRSADSDLTVQNYLIDIQTALVALGVILDSAVTNLNDAAASITTNNTVIDDETLDIVSASVSIETDADDAIADMRAIKNSAGEAFVDSSDIQTQVTAGKSTVTGFPTAGPSQLLAADRDAINGYFDLISNEASSITTATGTAIPNFANSAISDMQSILTSVEEIGTNIVTSDTHVKNILNASAIITTQVTIIEGEATNIDDAEAALGDVVTASEAGINSHLDKLLSADCKANVVSVPILVRDAGGFYIAPSSGLIDSLQNYLDGRKEVTQTVAVTSGENFLVRAVVRVRVGVLRGYSQAVVATAVEAVVDGVLRDRVFEERLYESDLDDVILEVEGVGFVNARIEGYLDVDGVTVLTDKLDSDGNLAVLEESDIITRGTVTVSTEDAPTT